MKKMIQIVLGLGLSIALLAGCGDANQVPNSSQNENGENTEAIVVDDRGVPALHFPVPAGFVLSEDSEGKDLYYTENYPDDMTNMIVRIYDYDEYGTDWTEETFREQYEAGYEQAGTPISELTYNKFEKGTLEGEFETLLIDYNILFGDDMYRQVEQLTQVGTRTYVQTYTQFGTEDTDYLKAFMDCVNAESIVYE